MTIEKLTKQIYAECLKEGEPVTLAEAENMARLELKAKENKPKLSAKAENEPKKVVKTPKIDTEKVEIIQNLADFVQNAYGNVKITNNSKIIEFKIGENDYKIDLIKTRKKKNA